MNQDYRAGFIPALNGIRAIAAFAVLCRHSTESGYLPRDIFGPVTAALGVMLFFSLSGFLMGHLYLRQAASVKNIGHYAVARFARIYPLFFAVTLLCLAISQIRGSFSIFLNYRDAVQLLVLLGDAPTLWTISTECQFYVVFVVLWIIGSAVPVRRAEFVVAAVCLFVIAAIWLADFPGTHNMVTKYIHFFLAGVLAAIALPHARPPLARWFSLGLPLLLTAFLLAFPPIADPFGIVSSRYNSLILSALTGLIVLSAATATGFFAERVIGGRVMVYFGELSYGIYLLHRPVLWAWGRITRAQGPLMFGVVLATVTCLAHLAYVHLERPARILLTRPTRSPVTKTV